MTDTSRLRQVDAQPKENGPSGSPMPRPSRPVDHTIREGYLTRANDVGPAVEVARQREVVAPPTPGLALPVAAPLVAASHVAVQRASNPGIERRQQPEPAAAIRASSARPAVSFRHDGPPAALEGSTIVETAARIAAAGGRQRSVVLIRVRVPVGLAGAGPHVFELRALILANGRDIIRYTIYRDPSAAQGFEPTGPCGLAIEMREVQVFAAKPDRSAEAHLRFDGVLRLPTARVQFHGLLLIDGAGLVRAVEPTVDGAGAIGWIQDGTIEITWA